MSDNKAEFEDSLGRLIKIRKLTPLDRMRIFEALGPSLSENASYLAYAFAASCVTQIDATPVAFPRSVKTLEATVDMLGDEGLNDVSVKYKDTFSPEVKDENKLDADEIKN